MTKFSNHQVQSNELKAKCETPLPNRKLNSSSYTKDRHCENPFADSNTIVDSNSPSMINPNAQRNVSKSVPYSEKIMSLKDPTSSFNSSDITQLTEEIIHGWIVPATPNTTTPSPSSAFSGSSTYTKSSLTSPYSLVSTPESAYSPLQPVPQSTNEVYSIRKVDISIGKTAFMPSAQVPPSHLENHPSASIPQNQTNFLSESDMPKYQYHSPTSLASLSTLSDRQHPQTLNTTSALSSNSAIGKSKSLSMAYRTNVQQNNQIRDVSLGCVENEHQQFEPPLTSLTDSPETIVSRGQIIARDTFKGSNGRYSNWSDIQRAVIRDQEQQKYPFSKNTQQISYPSSLTLKDEETNNALHPHDNNRGFSRKIGVVEQNIIEALKNDIEDENKGFIFEEGKNPLGSPGLLECSWVMTNRSSSSVNSVNPAALCSQRNRFGSTGITTSTTNSISSDETYDTNIAHRDAGPRGTCYRYTQDDLSYSSPADHRHFQVVASDDDNGNVQIKHLAVTNDPTNLNGTSSDVQSIQSIGTTEEFINDYFCDSTSVTQRSSTSNGLINDEIDHFSDITSVADSDADTVIIESYRNNNKLESVSKRSGKLTTSNQDRRSGSILNASKSSNWDCGDGHSERCADIYLQGQVLPVGQAESPIELAQGTGAPQQYLDGQHNSLSYYSYTNFHASQKTHLPSSFANDSTFVLHSTPVSNTNQNSRGSLTIINDHPHGTGSSSKYVPAKSLNISNLSHPQDFDFSSSIPCVSSYTSTPVNLSSNSLEKAFQKRPSLSNFPSKYNSYLNLQNHQFIASLSSPKKYRSSFQTYQGFNDSRKINRQAKYSSFQGFKYRQFPSDSLYNQTICDSNTTLSTSHTSSTMKTVTTAPTGFTSQKRRHHIKSSMLNKELPPLPPEAHKNKTDKRTASGDGKNSRQSKRVKPKISDSANALKSQEVNVSQEGYQNPAKHSHCNARTMQAVTLWSEEVITHLIQGDAASVVYPIPASPANSLPPDADPNISAIEATELDDKNTRTNNHICWTPLHRRNESQPRSVITASITTISSPLGSPDKDVSVSFSGISSTAPPTTATTSATALVTHLAPPTSSGSNSLSAAQLSLMSTMSSSSPSKKSFSQRNASSSTVKESGRHHSPDLFAKELEAIGRKNFVKFQKIDENYDMYADSDSDDGSEQLASQTIKTYSSHGEYIFILFHANLFFYY